MNLVDVRLVGIPLAIHQATSQHSDEVMREFSHLLEGPGESHAPARLITLDRILQERYSGFTEVASAELEEAVERGEDNFEISFQLPPDAGAAALELAGLWDEVDRYCEEGEYLLTLKSDPEMVLYRRWVLEEFARQASGAAPRSWADWRAGQGPS